MTTETTTDTEVKNPAGLLAKNKELLASVSQLTARVTELEGQLQQAQEGHTKALEAAQADQNAWKVRWHQDTVLKALERDIQDAAAGPWKYLRDTCQELGLLKMLPGDDGLERPHWFDEKGNPAELKEGLWSHLAGVYGRTNDRELGTSMRGTGASGSGAGPSERSIAIPSPEPAPEPAAAPTFGLR